MKDPAVIDIETLIAQARSCVATGMPAPWPSVQKLVEFLCKAMEAMVGEVRVARDAEAKARREVGGKGGA